MPLSGALFSSVSGLDATSTAISVVGDNIANVNTTGFKARRTEFADVLGQSISTAGGFSQIGAGSKVSEIRSLYTQGTFETTNRQTDVAIEGRGFFVLDGPQGRAYSRAGIFNFDSDGYLVSPTGLRVQGYGIDPVTGLSNGQLGDIQISNAISLPRTTANVSVSANLGAAAPLTPGGFDPADPSGSSDLQTVITVYDSLGIEHAATLYFTHTGSNAWEWSLGLAPGDTTLAPANPGDATVLQGSGTLTFDANGILSGATGTSLVLEFGGGAAPAQAVTLDFGAFGVAGSGGTTQVGDQPSNINGFTQDGFGPGSLQGLLIDSVGYLSGVFSNGETTSLAQLALADFPNLEGLQRVGNNNLVETRTSGQPLIGEPRTGGFGAVRSSSLEQSNVDLATEFVRLIINQRAFQANTRTISTTNDLLGDLVQLGR
ncbi:MAG: flagellar hook protein FlgE [Deltaproteobacteria bacterium]|nr:flagellar hook protein FlgE [Deltaproteobacteria bacterium]